MAATGIGYAGLPGAWWLPATAPFPLPVETAQDLAEMGRAIFVLLDVVQELYGTNAGAAAGLNRLLEQRVPATIPRLSCAGLVQSVRPDFQLVPRPQGGYGLVATELEICPSAQGFVHAMQVGYGLTPDLADLVAKWLGGRPLLFVGTEQWSEFLWEQLAFCRALAERGAQAYVLYDRPLAQLAAEVQAGVRWQPPIFGVDTKPAHWEDDLPGRMGRAGLTRFWWPDDLCWPATVGDAVVFRFGYVDCFAPAHLHYFEQWAAQGATLLNPPAFLLDSKVVMAALSLPAVRSAIQAREPVALASLDACLPETMLVEEAQLPRLLHEQSHWVIKFAGFDGGNRAWGGRSLRSGAECTAAEWRAHLLESLKLPWPVVAQRATPSARVEIDYFDEQGQVHRRSQGVTRLRAFLWRQPAGAPAALVGGVHLTVSAGATKVAEGTEAVQTPVLFLPTQ